MDSRSRVDLLDLTDNPDFFGGSHLEQRPLFALQGHLIYNFRPGVWIGLDAGVAQGGRITIDGSLANKLQQNSRAGLTVAYALNRQIGLRAALSSGLSTHLGADFTNIIVGAAYAFGGGLNTPRTSQ